MKKGPQINKKEKKKFLPLLKIIQKLPKEHVQHLINYLSDEAIDNICECVYNVVNVDLNLSKEKKKKLKKCIHKECSVNRLKCIMNKSQQISKRRKALSMEGKGLGLLLSAAIPFLTNLIFGKKNEG